jgi:hypothetical protein
MIEDAQALPTLDGLLFEAPGRDPEMRILIDDISTVAFPIPATSDPGEIRLAEGALFISPRIFGKEIEAFDFQRYEPAGNAWRTISHRRLGRMQYFEQELSDTAALPARGVYRLVVSDRSGRRFPWKQWRTDLRPRVLAGERGGHSDPLRLLLEVKLRARYSLDLYSPSGECLLRLPERLMEPGIREIFVPGRELAGNPAGAYFARVRSGDQFTTSKLVLTN